MIYYHDLYQTASFADYFSVIFHGFQLDASMAGYLTLLPGLFLIASLWVNPKVMKRIFKGYYIFICSFISIVFVADMALYRFWGFRLDSTPLFYLRTPIDAMASVSLWVVLAGILAMILIGCILYSVCYRVLIREKEKQNPVKYKYPVAIVLLLLTGLLFIPVRGGFTVSTMNTGKVYYSDKMELNHAAVNPMFSLLESLTMEQDFSKQYRFMDDNLAKTQFAGLIDQPSKESIPSLFTVQHPNVVFVVLESFMSKDLEVLGGIPNVAVRMNSLCKEGVLFTHFYANSFRTDRGLVSIFSGYPAQPTTSIMKYTHKSQSLPSIPKSLKKAGYDLQYYYGGDADFTNMRSYLHAMGIEKIVSDKDFPLKDRMTKWGAPDHIVFNRLASDLTNVQQKEPFMKICQTLSSHEPFQVPSHRHEDPYLNSVSYTDSCLGDFIDRFKRTKYWKNSIVIMVPDHAMRYPAGIDNRAVNRYKIPLLIVGGALKEPRVIDTYASQIDISATLLSQLNLSHSDYMFSKNILNHTSPHFGFFDFPNGFGMVTPENEYVFDCDSKTASTNTGFKNYNKRDAEAFLQILYDDLAKR
jgi:phosphoglycerol transferase MdoB-like AlkP superfamily enzyme